MKVINTVNTLRLYMSNNTKFYVSYIGVDLDDIRSRFQREVHGTPWITAHVMKDAAVETVLKTTVATGRLIATAHIVSVEVADVMDVYETEEEGAAA